MNAGTTSPAALRIAQSVETIAQLALINTTLLTDRCIVEVAENNGLYVLRKDSVAAESSPNIIAPDGSAWPGRWYLFGAGTNVVGGISIVRPALGAQQTADVAFSVPGLLAADVIALQLTDTTYAAGITEGPVRVTGAGAAQVRFANVSSGTVAGATTTYRVGIIRG